MDLFLLVLSVYSLIISLLITNQMIKDATTPRKVRMAMITIAMINLPFMGLSMAMINKLVG